ncbi:MAG: Glu-tRNA(Gln) amidotransferase subunit GatE [Candidatus Diapherotrites archaeon]|nr:Glu-tRNA(Gln) amidotransferase subunit GatE [Candidatus Diapherotrites archaeon]
MGGVDYNAIGLKAGLEVHQQLDTGKLFCRCPSKLVNREPDFRFTRKLRLAASELGEFDRAALEQFKKGTVYEYEFFNECCCLVECDEEPPKQADRKALEVALKIALMCNAHIFDELIVMRKIVIDGSNVSGFQRTMLIAENGKLDIGNKEIGIQTIVLEEDAARPMKKEGNKIVYRLDRLGIPLIEIATAPQLKTPQEVKLCALKIGELLRRTCKVKRGLGTIRQDINISIANGARIELKGVQELELIDKYVENEVKRQLALLEIKEELAKRGVKEQELVCDCKMLSKLFESTQCKIIASGLKRGKQVFGIKLNKFAGLLGKEVQPGRRFGTELADCIKVRHGLAGLFHSDELPKYGITEREVASVKQALACRAQDAFVLLVTDESTAKKAFETIIERCKIALKGVPEETREALPDGNSCYKRPLPGSARMYPETDIPKTVVSKEMIEQLRKELPLTVEQRLALYKKHGLSEKLANEMKLSNYACFFEELIKQGFDAKRCAVLLLEELKSLERSGFDVENIREEDIVTLLEAERSGFNKDLSLEVLKEKAKHPEKSMNAIIESFKKAGMSEKEVKEIIASIVEKNRKLVLERKERAINALMGEAMSRLRGKVEAKLVASMLKKAIAELLSEN